MSGTLTGLYVTHRKQREQERAKRAQYWREQVMLLWLLILSNAAYVNSERFPSKSYANARNGACIDSIPA